MRSIKHFVEQSWLLIVASFFFGLLIAVTNAALSARIAWNATAKLNTLAGICAGERNSGHRSARGQGTDAAALQSHQRGRDGWLDLHSGRFGIRGQDRTDRGGGRAVREAGRL